MVVTTYGDDHIVLESNIGIGIWYGHLNFASFFLGVCPSEWKSLSWGY